MAPANEGIHVRVRRVDAATTAAGAAAAAAASPVGDAGGIRFEQVRGDVGVEALASLDLEDLGLEVEIGPEKVKAVMEDRLKATAQVFTTLDRVKADLTRYLPAVPEQLPAAITGRFVNPDGSPAALVSVRALEPTGPSTTSTGQNLPVLSWPNPETRTDARGSFRLALPSRPLPDDGLRLMLTGGNRIVEYGLARKDLVAGEGKLGILPLDEVVTPLPTSVLAQLGEVVVVPTGEEDVLGDPGQFAQPVPVFTLGEGECGQSFRSNAGIVDRYRYSMLVRLVAPQLSNRRLATRFGDRGMLSATAIGLTKYLGTSQIIEAMGELGSWEIVERVPIEQPIDVGNFLQLVETNPRAVPKAASLGLGYVVGMHQTWIPQGLSLGDLVYSLPLAPGEQQRVAVSDERETLSVRDQESMTADEFQAYNEQADSSTDAVFRSAFDESARGGSSMKVRTESGSFGGGLGIGAMFSGVVAGLGLAGGYADSTTTGSTSSWQTASRDYVSSSAQDFHSSLARQASARRRATRTSVRLASSSERREVVTKVITNHNHAHALTMQYWEVLRHFAVSSAVDDVQLVCFVPLELVQFLPSGQPRLLPTGTYTRAGLLARYASLLRHDDVIELFVLRKPDLARGLTLLRSLAGDPTMTVQSSSGSAQDIIDVSLTGTFLPFEDLYVTAVSKTGARVGPVKLDAASPGVAAGIGSKSALLQALRDRRAGAFETRTAALALPDYIARSHLARFEFSRQWRTFGYKLDPIPGVDLGTIENLFGFLGSLDVTLRADELEREIGGPIVLDPLARISTLSLDVIEAYNGPGGTDRMPAVMPVAAKRLPPELSFTDLLRIERLLQHVVQNTTAYSKAVWTSLTAEERAIMLEQFTIGVPQGGIADPSSQVPLLNCVANQVIGYFGNAAIMPFFVPAPLADEIGFTSRDVQEALLKFHRQAFVPPQSSVTLPARGVLGEAVLGSCASAEKIDLTRFWNWQDSPGDEAEATAAVATAFGSANQLVGPNGAAGPASLESSPMITINQGPAALTPADLATALIASQPESNLPKDLTGITQLGAQMKVQTETTADSLNKTISEASGLAKAAMQAVTGAIGAKNGQGQQGQGGSGSGGSGSGGSGSGSGGSSGGGGTGGSSGGGTGGGTGSGGSSGGGSGGGTSGSGTTGGSGGTVDGGAAPSL